MPRPTKPKRRRAVFGKRSGRVRSYTKADAWPWQRNVLSSIHCPRGLSRLTLEIVRVRAERVQGISAADAAAEGHPIEPWRSGDPDVHGDAAIDWYRDLWDSINIRRAPWSSNPWVWVIGFRPVDP